MKYTKKQLSFIKNLHKKNKNIKKKNKQNCTKKINQKLAGVFSDEDKDQILQKLRLSYKHLQSNQDIKNFIETLSIKESIDLINHLRWQLLNHSFLFPKNEEYINRGLYKTLYEIMQWRKRSPLTNEFEKNLILQIPPLLPDTTLDNPPILPQSTISESKKPIDTSSTSSPATGPLTKDGRPDMRYAINRVSTSDKPIARTSKKSLIYSKIFIPPRQIIYTDHANEQMALPERNISRELVERIITSRPYSYTTGEKGDLRREYIEHSADPNNFVKIITNDSDNPITIITAIRNNPTDDDNFTYTALKTIEEENLDKNLIIHIINNVIPVKFGKDKLKFSYKNEYQKISVVSNLDKNKILSIRVQSIDL